MVDALTDDNQRGGVPDRADQRLRQIQGQGQEARGALTCLVHLAIGTRLRSRTTDRGLIKTPQCIRMHGDTETGSSIPD